MTMTVTATPAPVAAVALRADGVPAAASVTSWQVIAHTSAGDYTVRGTPVYVDPDSVTLTDYYPPLSELPDLDRPITYTVRAFTTGATVQADSAVVHVAAPACALLTDSEHPTNTLAVDVVAQDPSSWESRSVRYNVIGRADPVVGMQTSQMRDGTLVLLTDTISERVALRELLRGGAPLLLRSTNPGRVDDLMLLPTTSTATERINLREGRVWTIEYAAVAIDLGPYPTPPDRTYGTLAGDGRVPTYADLAGNHTYRNYLEVLDGVP